MECERLKKLIKNWYGQVQDETMAPARMVDFMNNHASDCSTCMADPVIEIEIKRITEIVLPPAKITKAARKVKAQDNEEDKTAPPADDTAPEDVKTENVDTEDDIDQDDEGDVDVDPDEDEI